MTAWGKAQGLFLSDEEMGKKDDDHKPSAVNVALRSSNWHPTRGPHRRSLKRIFLVFLTGCLVYLFIHNIPTDLGPRNIGRPHYGGAHVSLQHPPASEQLSPVPPAAPPKSVNDGAKPLERTYNGPPKFERLGESLRSLSGMGGGMVVNKNILFAAFSLKSAASLLPVACQMGMQASNYVHFAFLGRSDINLKELAKLNGIDEDCQINFHDARTINAAIMTDEAMEYSVFRAFHHIHTYMHPQAVIIDGSRTEDWYFQKSARSHAMATSNTLIELPSSSSSLGWIASLDSRSLNAWDKINIDILVQATSGSSGNLLRLLKSLSQADYSSCSIPHLTIELPTDVDPPTLHFLEEFQWPPPHVLHAPGTNYLTLRHRIPHRRLTEEESSIRFLESFWPANPLKSHVLVLSPKTEVAPSFFHYLKYSTLEYKYSATGRNNWNTRLFGISLEQPLKHITGDQKLTLPSLLNHQTDTTKISSSFLWQAPTSHAMLYFGDKWAELHDLVSRSLEVQRNANPVPALLSEKVVSTRHPSWLEHALRLSRLRGYWTLYPGEQAGKSLVTVHEELHQTPEEYMEVDKPTQLADDASEDDIKHAMLKNKAGTENNVELLRSLQGLLEAGALRQLNELPLLAWDGEKTGFDKLVTVTTEYMAKFRETVGRCKPEEVKKTPVEIPVKDLFCTVY
ncbi:hypothetical protein BX600DRAFT_428857 [Xylariales sp. PMI_506]|nr:hypothetical protein BX600DRAFT_428857 [Xylariales sp. PMI_506]